MMKRRQDEMLAIRKLDKEHATGIVRKVAAQLDRDQLWRAIRSGRASGFHRAGFWFGETDGAADSNVACMCAAAFGMEADSSSTSWWEAKLDDASLRGYEFLLHAAGGDQGVDDFVAATYSLSSEELVGILERLAEEGNHKAQAAG